MGKDIRMEYERFDFADDGVTVILPPGGRNIGVRKLPFIWKRAMWGDGFGDSGRFVINFELYDRLNPDEKIDGYEQPIELWVRFTAEDAERAGGAENLDLFYWDGEKWNSLKERGLILVGRKASRFQGYGVVSFEYTGDPPICWRP